MGGTRFGPFGAKIEIGSDPKRNALVLDSRHGVFPTHAVVQQADPPGTLVVQPAGPQCQVFVIPQGQSHPWPVKAPVQVKTGDQLVFGTPTGPRFVVQVDLSALHGADHVMQQAAARGGEAGALHAIGTAVDRVFGAPKVGGVAGEVHRRSQSSLLTTSPGREIYALYTRAKSGVLTSPRTVVGLIVAIVGLMFTGGLTCSGIIAAFYRVVIY
jgi:hypothetical protein